MPGPYQWWDLSNFGAGRLSVAINCGVLSVNTLSATPTNDPTARPV